jgi:hypothetical protein
LATQASVDTIDAIVDAILVDTGTTLDTKLNDIQGATFATGTDSLEALRNRGDSAWTGSAVTSNSGTAQAGSSTTITLQSGASTANDTYNGQLLFISSGTGIGQSRAISDYVGSTLVATVVTAFTVTPDATSVYAIYPDEITEISAAPTAAAIADAVWDENTTGHTTASTFGEQVKNDIDAILIDTSSTLDNAITTIGTNVDAILVDTGTTIPATITTVDTNVDAILVDTGTTIPALIGTPATDLAADIAAVPTAAEILTQQITESYSADGVAPTLAQAIMAIQQRLLDADVSGTTLTVRQLDGTTAAMTLTLDNGTTPTDINRTG